MFGKGRNNIKEKFLYTVLYIQSSKTKIKNKETFSNAIRITKAKTK